MQLSAYLKEALCDQLLITGTAYLALYTSDPTENNTGIEVSGGSYARQEVIFGSPVDGTCTNSEQVTFPLCTFAWGAVTHAALFDAVSNGNMLFFAQLNETKTITATDQLIFGVGSVSVGFL
jgi:hypothetical protein